MKTRIEIVADFEGLKRIITLLCETTAEKIAISQVVMTKLAQNSVRSC
jgi:hypothetical protein